MMDKVINRLESRELFSSCGKELPLQEKVLEDLKAFVSVREPIIFPIVRCTLIVTYKWQMPSSPLYIISITRISNKQQEPCDDNGGTSCDDDCGTDLIVEYYHRRIRKVTSNSITFSQFILWMTRGYLYCG